LKHFEFLKTLNQRNSGTFTVTLLKNPPDSVTRRQSYSATPHPQPHSATTLHRHTPHSIIPKCWVRLTASSFFSLALSVTYWNKCLTKL